MLLCCFFKQKTAYEMRISDWSSDVCSSDLRLRVGLLERDLEAFGGGALASALEQRGHVVGGDDVAPASGGGEAYVAVARGDVQHLQIGRAAGRESVCQNV